MLTKEDLAKYPFLDQSAAFIEKYNLTLTDLSAPAYSGIVDRAFERVRGSIEGEEASLNLGDPETEILSYPLALAVVYASKVRWLVNRFATYEAKRCEELLKLEVASKLAEIAKASFGWKVELQDVKLEWERRGFKLRLDDYLEVAPQFHSPAWKLTNKYVDKGSVFLDSKDFARLLSENLKLRITKRANEEGVKNFELPAAFQTRMSGITALLDEKKQFYEDELPDGLVEDARPPCIIAIVNDLSAGKSLSHMARFTITTFMLNVGESVDGVLKLFGNVADFDEGKARYQVEHIAGITGSRTKYAPPKCEVLRSFGLCIEPDALCASVSHPLNYYKRKVKAKAQMQTKTQTQVRAPQKQGASLKAGAGDRTRGGGDVAQDRPR